MLQEKMCREPGALLCLLCFLFNFYSFLICPNQFPSLRFTQSLPLPLSPRSASLLFPFQTNKKSRPPRDIHWTWSNNKTRHIPTYQGWTRQPSKKKRVPGTKESEASHTQTHVGNRTGTPSHTINIYAEELAQTHIGVCMFFISVSLQSLWALLSWLCWPCSHGILDQSGSHSPSLLCEVSWLRLGFGCEGPSFLKAT